MKLIEFGKEIKVSLKSRFDGAKSETSLKPTCLKGRIMKSLFIALFVTLSAFSAQAFNNEESLVRVLDQYSSIGDGGCRVSFDSVSDVFTIDGGENRESLSRKINYIEVNGPALIAYGGDYDADVQVTMLREFYSLKIFMTWKDNEMGPDKATFCEIQIK